jgi:hypothetical protein
MIYNSETRMLYQAINTGPTMCLYYNKIGHEHRGTREIAKKGQSTISTWIKDGPETYKERQARQQAEKEVMEKAEFQERLAQVSEKMRENIRARSDFIDIFEGE